MRIANTAVLRTIFATKGNFAQGICPSKKLFSGIEVTPFKDNAGAAVCISGDFEMSWAWRGRGHETAKRRGITERRNVPVILKLLEEYSIPITWATVGHLFLESCTRSTSGLAHAGMPRPRANDGWSGDWYMHDPCSNAQKDPLWYAPDLIQKIIESRIRHEVGTHSFSHINFSAHCSTTELVHRELESCIDAMRPFGIRPRSLVFPRNIAEYSYLPLLASAGIVAVRHRDERIRLSYPERTPSGVYKVYESMNLRTVKHYDYLQKAKIFIQKAMERRAVYSLWFHPSDPMEVFDAQFRRILQYIDSERKSGRLWVATMQDLTAYCEARERLQLTTSWEENILTVSVRTSLDTSRYGTPEISLLIPASSPPKSAWLEAANGERSPVNVRFASDDRPPRLIVAVPANAKAFEFTF